MRAVEKFYSVEETALLLSFSAKTIIQKMKAREFGEDVANLGTEAQPDYRIPASGINAYLVQRRLFTETGIARSPFPEMGIAARTLGELRRKAAAKAGAA